jgi:hypothetical protein
MWAIHVRESIIESEHSQQLFPDGGDALNGAGKEKPAYLRALGAVDDLVVTLWLEEGGESQTRIELFRGNEK